MRNVSLDGYSEKIDNVEVTLRKPSKMVNNIADGVCLEKYDMGIKVPIIDTSNCKGLEPNHIHVIMDGKICSFNVNDICIEDKHNGLFIKTEY